MAWKLIDATKLANHQQTGYWQSTNYFRLCSDPVILWSWWSSYPLGQEGRVCRPCRFAKSAPSGSPPVLYATLAPPALDPLARRTPATGSSRCKHRWTSSLIRWGIVYSLYLFVLLVCLVGCRLTAPPLLCHFLSMSFLTYSRCCLCFASQCHGFGRKWTSSNALVTSM